MANIIFRIRKRVIWALKANKDSQNVFDLKSMVAFSGLVSFIKKEVSKRRVKVFDRISHANCLLEME